MATDVTWYQENRFILVRLQGEFTQEEMVDVNAEIVAHIRRGSQTAPLVHALVDTQFMTKSPTNLVAIMRALTYLKETTLGWTVIVGMSPVVRFLGSMLTQMAGVRFRMFPTLEEAVTFLINQDESIIDLEMQPQ